MLEKNKITEKQCNTSIISDSALIVEFMGVKERKLTFNSYGKPSPSWYINYLGYRTPTFNTKGKSLEFLLKKKHVRNLLGLAYACLSKNTKYNK